MGIKEYRATGGNVALLKDYHRQSDSLAQWQINFLPYSEQTYAFDYIGSGNHGIFSDSKYYPYLFGNYDLRYKSVETGKTDKVIVDFGSYPERDSVIFKDKYGVTLKLSKDNVLNFTGVAKPDTNYIYAYRGDEKIGKLSVNTYRQKTYNVVLVSVNGAKLPKISKLEEYLNEVYKQSVVNFEISTDELSLNDLTSFSHGGSGVLTVYNDDQKTVLRAYDPQMQDGVYYLFFIDNVTDKKDGDGTMVSGYMPRGYNAGFIYDGGSPHTIAHELGHGIAGLEHVFSDSKSSGKTKNLMDYSSGEELWHFQWDEIQDPSRVWMKWNKAEEEGESLGSYPVCVLKFLEKFRRAYVYKEPFKFDIIDEYSAENIQLLNHKDYKKIGWETTQIVNSLIDTLKRGEKIGNEYKYSYEGFTIISNTVGIYDYLFPSKEDYDEQMKSYRNFIVNTLNDRDEIIRRLSTLPEPEFLNFDFEQRKKLLEVLSSAELYEKNSFCVDGEKSAINLVKYIPDNQINNIYQLLSGDFYKQLCSQIDDAFGDDNFTELKKIVSDLDRKSSHTARIISKIRNYVSNKKYICDHCCLLKTVKILLKI